MLGAHRALLFARALLVDHLADGETADVTVRVYDVRDTEMVQAFVVAVESPGTLGCDPFVRRGLRGEPGTARASAQAGNGDDDEDRDGEQKEPAAAEQADAKAAVVAPRRGAPNGGPGYC